MLDIYQAYTEEHNLVFSTNPVPAKSKTKCLGYSGFYQSLLQSPSREARVLSRLVRSDPRSSSCLNLRYLAQKTGLSKPEQLSSARIRMDLPVKVVPDTEKWRLGLITRFMKMKAEKHLRVADSKHITAMMDSLCST